MLIQENNVLSNTTNTIFVHISVMFRYLIYFPTLKKNPHLPDYCTTSTETKRVPSGKPGGGGEGRCNKSTDLCGN